MTTPIKATSSPRREDPFSRSPLAVNYRNGSEPFKTLFKEAILENERALGTWL